MMRSLILIVLFWKIIILAIDFIDIIYSHFKFNFVSLFVYFWYFHFKLSIFMGDSFVLDIRSFAWNLFCEINILFILDGLIISVFCSKHYLIIGLYIDISLIVFIEILIGIWFIFVSDSWKQSLMIDECNIEGSFKTLMKFIWICVYFSQIICFWLKFRCMIWNIMIYSLKFMFCFIDCFILSIF